MQRLTREERKEERREKVRNLMEGEGRFIFENNTSGDLKLPKAAINGQLWIGKRKKFIGDSYFLQLVRTGMLRLIQTLPDEVKPMNENTEEKLILDQPDRYTHEGMTEQVKKNKPQKLNETKGAKVKSEKILLTEDPSSSIEIISD